MRKRNHIAIITLLALLMGCAGIQPKPVYTSKPDKYSETSTKKSKNNKSDSNPIISDPVKLPDYNLVRGKIILEIENSLGIPYRLGGDTPRGMDCSGFVKYIFQKTLDITLPRQVSALKTFGKHKDRKNLQFGDLVFFNNIESANISHVGIYLDLNQFVHASLSKGVIISSLDESYYNKRYAGARRVSDPLLK